MTMITTKNKKASRPQRVSRIAKKLAIRSEKRKAARPKEWGSKPLRRKEYSLRRRHLIAYDLETTRIRADETPKPLYLTAYGENFKCSARITSDAHFLTLVESRFLVPEFNRARFVAWNGNNFDVYLLARAMLLSDDYIIRPYLTRSKNLRGMKIIRKAKWMNAKGKEIILSWEFLDGISMTGSVGVSLKKFLAQFAPDYGKLEGPDFEKEDFDYRNPAHVAYAERDSEGLYHAMLAVENIVVENFGMALQPTIGNLGIKLFQGNMPNDATVWKPPYACLSAIRAQVLRGGYCHRQRRYDGPLWKYDLNQAYAAAMRDARLPSGRATWSPAVKWRPINDPKVINPYAKTYIARVRGRHPGNNVPFYVRNMEGVPTFATDEIPETWLTSLEIKQLRDEGAKLEVMESYFWDESFTMKRFVDRLEELRMNAEGGPSGPKGQVIKYIGNNAYGKTVERLDGIELIMALNCPDGYNHYQSENDRLQCVWYKFADPVMREYHQPQLGAFITAHVRMVLRRAILLAPDSWIYADTDCVAFDKPITGLDIDPKKYGLWKIEESGTEYYVIEKKVYARKDGSVMHAKGLNVKRLKLADFEAWYAGRPPEQTQVQRNNFVSFVAGETMFKERKKVGQRL